MQLLCHKGLIRETLFLFHNLETKTTTQLDLSGNINALLQEFSSPGSERKMCFAGSGCELD